MSAKSEVLVVVKQGAMLLAALSAVTVLLAAMPAHKAPVVGAGLQEQGPPQSGAAAGMDHSRMAGMDHQDEQTNETAAVHDMTPGMSHGPTAHMTMTAMGTRTAEDVRRASLVVSELREGIEKYKDYHVALEDGYRIFLPNVPQPEYHFTSYKNAFSQAIRFDATRPTSLLYKKTAGGYELVGAMYTMPKRATEAQLDERVPLSVATWHLHTNLCMPPKDALLSADWTKFGLHGSIATEDACTAAGGRFRPSIFGWMVHVYPYEDSLDKTFAMHTHKE